MSKITLVTKVNRLCALNNYYHIAVGEMGHAGKFHFHECNKNDFIV